jgi:hypothetical protein
LGLLSRPDTGILGFGVVELEAILGLAEHELDVGLVFFKVKYGDLKCIINCFLNF